MRLEISELRQLSGLKNCGEILQKIDETLYNVQCAMIANPKNNFEERAIHCGNNTRKNVHMNA